MKKGDYLEALLRSEKTVFSTKDISILWQTPIDAAARARLHYAVARGKLIRLRQGVYAKDPHYNAYELAVKLNTPSYISFETVLAKAGVIFQYYDTIFVASSLSRTVQCDQHTISFKKIKQDVLTNPLGIIHNNTYAIATAERALLDMLYLHKQYHVDNVSVINWEKLFNLVTIYANQRLQIEVEKLYQEYQHAK